MKTEAEFLEAHRHEFGGLVLDALTCGHRGDAASLFVRQIMRKIDTRLALIHRTEIAPKAVSNGQPIPARKP